MEIELKLACETDALERFENSVLPLLTNQGIDVERSHAHLYNEYFDTPSEFFGKRKMGCRVRAKNHEYEQTVKTNGEVTGGLHQRPEYNVKLESPVPDLAKFPADIWEDSINIKQVNDELEGLFSTHFERTTFVLSQNDYKMEVVFDFGEVKRKQDAIPICEIELELIDGEAIHLFNIASMIVEHIPSRLSDVTKAARGYQLLHGNVPEKRSLPAYLKLNEGLSTEDAFCKTISIGLQHWQYHQHVYSQTNRLKALLEIRESLLILLQAVSLYLPVLQCKELLELHKALLTLNQAWAWQDQLESIHRLRSRKGPFSRRIPKNQNLMNYLMGRREGLLNAHKPHELNMSKLSAKVQLAASRILIEKPWQMQKSGSEISVKQHANGWLSQTWQTVIQSLPADASMNENQYVAIEVLLKQSLINGFMLSGLFADSRGQFRDPWLDLSSGIVELKAILLLHEALNDMQVDDKAEFSSWIQDKTHSLIKVMEQTRKVAMGLDTYW
ncbi:inorganic triphosphatase [Glaciecola sp. 2405UD65-10]|uniref:CYTH domain-containing protein n=1 Tax=Glaciecola sp. 2405UD65-10 TaxID=3397244 RepID=UPI003B5C414E